MENGTKLMIYKNRRVYINFRNGIPHIPVIDSWDGEELEFQIDPKFLGNIEDYP